MTEAFFAPLEVKLAEKAPVGEFSGYAACFGNEDAHSDVIAKGAFSESLAERKAKGRPVPMHLMHRMMGGDGLPVGVWKSLQEDERGLRVEGKISGINTDAGKLLYERVKDGAFGGLSIGYRVKPNGAVYGKAKGDPKRTLVNVDLVEISLVDEPSNALSRIDEFKRAVTDEVKAVLALADKDKATEALRAALTMCGSFLTGGDAPTADERKQMIDALQTAHQALTGSAFEMKVKPSSVREFETMLREKLSFTNSEARAIAERGFKALGSRDETEEQAIIKSEVKAVLGEIGTALSGFRLP